MATIAELVVKIGADPTGVRRGLERTNGLLRQFASQTERSFATAFRGLQNGKIVGTQAADLIVTSLKSRLESQLANTRENLFRGLITPEQAKKQAKDAGTAFNAGLLTSINELRANGLLTPAIRNDLVNQLRESGLKGGQEMAGAVIKSFGDSMQALGTKLTKNVTAPLLGAGAAMTHFAGEADLSAARLKLVWGPVTGEMEKALSDLHKVIPATMTDLRNMTSITSELLLPLGIAPTAMNKFGKSIEGVNVQKMSIDMVKLSKDLSILNNVSPERAMNALQSALVGLTRPLKLLGVLITERGIEQEAYKRGIAKTGQTLNETQKALAAYFLIMDRSKLVMNAAQTLSETYAVKLRMVKRDAIEAAIALGHQLIPAVLPLIISISNLLKWFAALDPKILRVIVILGVLAAAVGPTILVFGQLASSVGILILAFPAMTAGFRSFTLAITGTGVGLALLAIGIAIGVIVKAATNGSRELAKFRGEVAKLDTAQSQREMTRNATRELQLRRELVQLNRQTVNVTDAKTGIVTSKNIHQERINQINQELQSRQRLTTALVEQFTKAGAEEKKAAADLEEWNEKIKYFSENAPKDIEKVKTAIELLQDASQAAIDRLALFRELNLNIATPLATVQQMYDDMVKSVGGIANIHKLDADRLRIVLNLQKAINAAVEERNKAPGVAANVSFQNLEEIRSEAVQTGTIDIAMLQAAYQETVNKLKELDAMNQRLGDQVSPEMIRISRRIHDKLGDSFEQFAARLTVELNKGIEMITEAIPRPETEGIKKFFADLGQLSTSNRERFAALKAGFGIGSAAAGPSVAQGALDMLKSAALGVAESFGPLAILGTLIATALEPLEPAFKALMLPLQMVAKVLGAALIPVLRILFPIFKALAIAATYVAETLLRISSAILRAIGSLVRGLGRLINKLPGSPGDPLVRAGQAMLNLADAQLASARALADAREDIKKLSFDDAMDAVNGLAKAANDASQNIPQIFKLARAAFLAANPVSTTVTQPTNYTPQIGGGSGGTTRPGTTPTSVPVTKNTYVLGEGSIVIEGTGKSTRELVNEVENELTRRALLQEGIKS